MSGGFEWSERKRRQNLSEHGVDFAEAALIFAGATLEAVDDRADYGEIRYRALGRVGDAYLMVVYTWRGADRRLIGAWRVNERGRQRYEAILARRVAGDAAKR